jgi:hypothetical protein
MMSEVSTRGSGMSVKFPTAPKGMPVLHQKTNFVVSCAKRAFTDVLLITPRIVTRK